MPVEPGHHHRRKGQIWVGGGVRIADLDALRLWAGNDRMRHEAERLRASRASKTGASKPGISRL